MTADIVMLREGKHYAGPDEAITLRHSDYKGRLKSEEVIRPGQGDRPYFFYQSPKGRYLYVNRSIYRGVAAAYVYEAIAPGRLVPLHFGGMRLDEYVIRTFLKQIRLPAMLHRLENRVMHFEKWSRPDDQVLRVNIALTEFISDLVDKPGFHQPREWAAFCELDLVERRILRLVDISKQQNYNFVPSRPPER